MATCRKFTKGFEKPLRTYLRGIGTTTALTCTQNNILATSSIIQPRTFARLLSSCCNMVANIEIVYYAQIKDLPNHPEILLVDVREPDEIQKTGKIPTSINIPLARVQQDLGTGHTPEVFMTKYSRGKPNSNNTIIFHCRSGRRSQEAAEYAVSLGFTDVKNYKGSWNDWAEHEGLPH